HLLALATHRQSTLLLLLAGAPHRCQAADTLVAGVVERLNDRHLAGTPPRLAAPHGRHRLGRRKLAAPAPYLWRFLFLLGRPLLDGGRARLGRPRHSPR